MNLLRCSPNFHNAPRYDCALLSTMGNNGDISEVQIFARLLYAFVLQCGSESAGVPIAVVLPYDGSVRADQRKRDRDDGFYRVKERAPPSRSNRKRPQPEFIFAHSIIRGALLAPAGDQREMDSLTEFFVVDVVDADMFLHVRSMHGKPA